MDLAKLVKIGYLDFSGIKIAVIGDCMLDIYHYGIVDRISPEAPIPIFKENNTEPEYRLGGACNTALNLSKLGVQTTLFGFVGKDINATYIKSYLLEYNIKYQLLDLHSFPTITKNRYFSKNQQIIRIDQEFVDGLTYDLDNQNKLIKSFVNSLDSFDKFDVVIISDYGKGALYHPILDKIKEACADSKIPIFIDPKLNDWEFYKGAFCITPNWNEFKAVCNLPNLPKRAKENEIAKYAGNICRKYKLEYILVTMGSDGMILVDKEDHSYYVEAKTKEIYDVSGAGDTVIAVFAASYAKEYPIGVGIQLANLAAKVVVGKLGTYAITDSELNLELLNATFETEKKGTC